MAPGCDGGVGRPSSSPSSGKQDDGQVDPDLATVIAAWDDLPDAVRAGIVAMVRAAREG